MSDPDDEVDMLELVARWLEGCARYGEPWQLRRLAAQLRNGTWLDDPQKRSDRDILLARADDKLAIHLPLVSLTPAELAAVRDREIRRDARSQQDARRSARMVEQIEIYLQSQPEGTTEP